MKKHKLFSTVSLILSGIVIAMSGLIIVHSATSQSVASTLNVTYVANNVAFTASGYYQKKTDDSTTNLVYSGDNSSTTISFAPSNTSTTENLQTPSNSAVTLSTTDTYVLFTYVFHNDASNGGYCIKVSLTDGSTKTNVTCKYLVSNNAYVPAELSTFISSVTGDSAPTDVYITAQSTKYFYILVSVPNLSLTSSYTSTAVSGLVWSVENTDLVQEASPISIQVNYPGGQDSRLVITDATTSETILNTTSSNYNTITGIPYGHTINILLEGGGNIGMNIILDPSGAIPSAGAVSANYNTNPCTCVFNDIVVTDVLVYVQFMKPQLDW